MSILEMILTLLIPWGAVLWGVNIYHQKGTWFLAGWNTMREEEKASYNVEEMCHLFGRCVIFCGVGAFLLLYGSFNQNDYILCSGIGVVAIAVILSILLPKINPRKYRK